MLDARAFCTRHEPEPAYITIDAGILSRLIGRGNLTNEALPDSLRRLYGDNILTFGEGTWQDALDTATQLQRPLLLYIHSPEHIVSVLHLHAVLPLSECPTCVYVLWH